MTWLSELREYAPVLLTETYSNPYYTSIPEGWFETEKPRIMVVGEEGFGSWGCGKAGVIGDPENPFYSLEDISRIQAWNGNYLRSQLGQQNTHKKNNSPFWKRFRRVAEYGVCCWTNIDKIHCLSDSKCALTSKERALLHTTPTCIHCARKLIFLLPRISYFSVGMASRSGMNFLICFQNYIPAELETVLFGGTARSFR